MVTKSMNSNDYKVIYKNAEKEKIKNVVSKVKETYEKYEMGKIDFNNLRDVIVNDLQLSTTDQFDKLTTTAGRDNKTFAGLIKSLGILKNEKQKAPVFTPKQMKDSTLQRFPRYVRNRSYNVPQHPEDPIQNSVNAFLKRQMTGRDLETVLRDNNINPNIEEVNDRLTQINKLIRSSEAGANVKFNEMMVAIKKVNNNGVDPTSIKVDFKPPKYYTTHQQTETPKAKKGGNNPNYFSNKDLFDWEANEEKQAMSKLNDPQPTNLTTKTKFIFESNVFKKDDLKPQPDEKKSALKKVDPPKPENGNILTWKGPKVETTPVKEIKRRDPNVASGTDCSTKSPKRKVLKMHEVSEDNALVRKK